jgi:hypothetical protein
MRGLDDQSNLKKHWSQNSRDAIDQGVETATKDVPVAAVKRIIVDS